MKKEIADRLVQALRSGKYPQTTGVLHQLIEETPGLSDDVRPVGYCCLGVLCDLAAQEGVCEEIPLSKTRRKTRFKGLGNDHDASAQELPNAVKNWAGMRTRGGDLFGVDGVPIAGLSLMDLNDNGWNFKAISNHIERHSDNL